MTDDENALRELARWGLTAEAGCRGEAVRGASARGACALLIGRGTGQQIAAITNSATFFSATGLGTADQLLGELDQTRSPHANIEPGQMDRLPNGEFRLTDGPNRLPHSYTLQAINP